MSIRVAIEVAKQDQPIGATSSKARPLIVDPKIPYILHLLPRRVDVERYSRTVMVEHKRIWPPRPDPHARNKSYANPSMILKPWTAGFRFSVTHSTH